MAQRKLKILEHIQSERLGYAVDIESLEGLHLDLNSPAPLTRNSLVIYDFGFRLGLRTTISEHAQRRGSIDLVSCAMNEAEGRIAHYLYGEIHEELLKLRREVMDQLGARPDIQQDLHARILNLLSLTRGGFGNLD